MTPEDEILDGAETPKYRHLVTKYLTGSGIDIGTGGYAPVVPNAISVELPPDAFAKYTNGRTPGHPIHLTTGALDLPFKDSSLDYCFSSHLIEDFFDWMPVVREWTRVIKIGGHFVLLYPDKTLWNEAIARGRPCNCEHRHESFVGEMTTYMAEWFGHFETLEDRLTALTPDDYTILYAAKRVR